ncbi:MAG: DUF4230 domain-containing protein [Prevotella sp.]|nr:DUF4230 domain-containing protein [Prevotella sp.]
MKSEKNNLELVVKALTLVAIIIFLWWLLIAEKDNHIGLKVDDDINPTPEQIQSIRDIGQWEFLSISNEELVDTVRKGVFSDDQLVRIYYGTLRLGVDLSKTKKNWITAHGDTIVVRLPKVGLLDKEFIDETRTKAFYESGRWTARDREALYRKARRQMMSHALTKENLKTAEANAEHEVRRMMSAMGYNNITVKFDK